MFFLAEERRLNRRVALKLVLIFSLFIFHFSLIGQSLPDSGFTNKAEAKNLLVNGVRDGKWVEYLNSIGDTDSKNPHSPYYSLTVYDRGLPKGIMRIYYKSGKLYYIAPYINFKINGIERWYYENGKLESETPYNNGIINGVVKYYYKNGKLQSQVTFVNGKKEGEILEYDKNGNLTKGPPFHE